MPPCRGNCRARLYNRLRLQSISQDTTPSTLSGHLCDFFLCILWRRCHLMDSDRDGREARSQRKRTASAMMLQEAAYSRRQNSSSTRERWQRRSMEGLCAEPNNSRALCCNWHASSTKTTLGCTSSGIQTCRNPVCAHGHTHMGVVLPGRQLLSGDVLDTMTLTQLTQLDIMAEPDEDLHEEYFLTRLE
eukprot:219021-Chlamydomonas_euryale.AAC.3